MLETEEDEGADIAIPGNLAWEWAGAGETLPGIAESYRYPSPGEGQRQK